MITHFIIKGIQISFFLRRGVRDWSFNLGCWLSTLLKNIELYTVLLKQKNWKLIKHWYFVCYKIQFLYKICRMKPGFLNTDITIKYTKQYQMRTPTVAHISYALYLKKITFIYMYSLSYPVITLSISLTYYNPPPFFFGNI